MALKQGSSRESGKKKIAFTWMIFGNPLQQRSRPQRATLKRNGKVPPKRTRICF